MTDALTLRQLLTSPPTELVTRRAVAEPTCGAYRSLFKGQGTDFSELRAYQPGDDLRRIDWNVTARTGAPWVRLSEEERELTVYVIADVSGSMAYGSHRGLKGEASARVAANLVMSAQRAGDRVGLITFADRVVASLPPRKGRAHALRLLGQLLQPAAPGPGTDLRGALHRLLEVRRRSALVFVLSDFAAPSYDDLLRAAAARFDVVPIVVRDRAERALPSDGLVRLRDPESGADLTVDSSSSAVRRAWEAAARAAHERRERLFSQLHLNHLDAEAGDDVVRAVSNLMLRRAAGRRA